MKRKLLFAIVALLCTIGVRAQSWTASEVGAGDFYLYNVGKGQFLTRGNGWGTQASASANSALTLTFEEYNGAYKLRTNIQGTGKGLERLSDPVIYTDQSNGKNSTWTFTKVDDASNGPVYTIVSKDNHGGGAGSYMTASADNTIVGPADAVTDDYGRWQLLQSWITNSVPVNDATGWTTSQTPTFDGSNVCAEYWNKSGATIKQTLTNLPKGSYELIAVAFTRTGMTATLNAGSNTMNIVTVSSDDVNGRGGANTWFNNGNGVNKLEFTLAENTASLEIGLTADKTSGDHWLVWRSFVLLYKGIDLSEFKTALQAEIDAVPALEGTTTAAAYNAAKNYADGIDMDALTTEEAISTALSELTALVDAAKALQTSYANYSAIRTEVLALDDDATVYTGSATVDVSAADDAVAQATTVEAVNAAINLLRTAASDFITSVTVNQNKYFDLTNIWVVNPTVSQNVDGWNVENVVRHFSWSTGPTTNFGETEFYQSGFDFNQSVTLPAGTWEFGVTGFHRAGTYQTYFYAGEDRILIPGVGSDVVNSMADAKTYFDNGNGKVALKFLLESASNTIKIGIINNDTETDRWTIFRNFTLKYYGAPDYSTYVTRLNEALDATIEGLAALEGKVPAVITDEAATLESTYRDADLENKAAYLAAIATVEGKLPFAQAYVPFTDAINKIDAALAAATTATESTDDYDAIKAAYTAATIAEADVVENIAAAYNAVIPVIKSQTAESADFTLAIQNHSFEYGDMTGWTAIASDDTGVRSTSNNTYAATGSDGYYLFNTWAQGVPVTQAVTGLPNGQYTMTVSVASDGATIYLLANGEHNEGIETGGEYPSSNVFQEATMTFLVKDGTATIGAVGGAGGDAGVHKDYVEEGYWWYKADNFRLIKNRDLTPEEMAVVPTAIALYNGEEEVTEPIALNKDAMTVTLTPVYTPADATEGYINWESSDLSVATVSSLGEVTAVLPGTAIITATSTLDANVKATATVTVTFPESSVVSYVNEGATRTVYNLGENIIKNGSFEYPDNFYGWTSGTGAKLTSSDFSIQTTGAYDGTNYLKASKDKGQTDAGSIYTSWPVEAGKKYVFSYQMKNSSAVNNDDYIRTSLSATTSEDATSYSETFKAVSCGTDWTTLSYEFTVPDGKNYLVFSARWLKSSKSFDNFYLCEVLSDPTTEGNVDYATAAIPTANIGTGAFQYSQDAIDAANALVQGTATVEDVENAYAAVTTLNAPDAEKIYNIVVAEEGNSKVGNAVVIVPGATGANNPTGYGLNVTLAPNTNLNQAVTFTKASGNNYYISFETAAGTTYLTTGSLNGSAAGWNKQQIQATTDAEKKCAFTIVASTEDDVFYIYNPEQKDYIDYQDGGSLYTDTNIDHKAFSLVETTKPSITINTKAAGWGTVMLPFAQALPEGVKAYSVSELKADKEKLDLVEVTALEANKPYIIEGDWEANLTGDAQGTALEVEVGLLTGVYADQTATVGTYVLQMPDAGKVGFYQVADGKDNQPTVTANHAYLTAPASSEVKAFFLDEGTATAIQSVFSGVAAGEIYDLSGRKLNKLQKGVNIVNGKKVMVK